MDLTVSDRKPMSVVPVIVLLAMLGAYVGAYYATVRPLTVLGNVFAEYKFPAFLKPYEPNRYNTLHDGFAPIHWLDRRIRPHHWEPTP